MSRRLKACGHQVGYHCACADDWIGEEDGRRTHELDVTEQMERNLHGRRRSDLSSVWESD